MFITSKLYSFIIALLCFSPAWGYEKSFNVEVVNMLRPHQCYEDDDTSHNFRIGIGVDLEEEHLSRKLLSHSLPILPFTVRETSKRTMQLSKRQSTHQLSISILSTQSSLEERMDNFLYSYTPLMTMSTSIAERDLKGSTIYIMFQGLDSEAPLDVIVVTDNSFRGVPRFLVPKYVQRVHSKIINSLKNLLLR